MRSCVCGWVLLFLLFGFDSCSPYSEKNILLDIKTIANKNPGEVEKIIGPPDSAYTFRIMGKDIFCQLYKKYHIEIQYSAQRATDIIVHGPHDLPFNQTALSAFNLDYKLGHPSDYMKDRFIRWTDFDVFSAITFYDPERDSLHNITNFNIFFKVKE